MGEFIKANVTDGEDAAIEALNQAARIYGELPTLSYEDSREFEALLYRAQLIILARVGRRSKNAMPAIVNQKYVAPLTCGTRVRSLCEVSFNPQGRMPAGTEGVIQDGFIQRYNEQTGDPEWAYNIVTSDGIELSYETDEIEVISS